MAIFTCELCRTYVFCARIRKLNVLLHVIAFTMAAIRALLAGENATLSRINGRRKGSQKPDDCSDKALSALCV